MYLYIKINIIIYVVYCPREIIKGRQFLLVQKGNNLYQYQRETNFRKMIYIVEGRQVTLVGDIYIGER